MVMKQFSNKVAIVTGGGSGIGKALCAELGPSGAVVVVADVNEENARVTAEAINQQGGRANAQCLDVSDEKQVTKLVSDTAAANQRLDFMFNHAGINVLGDARDLRLEDWHHVKTGLQKSATVVNASHDQVMAQTTLLKRMDAAQAARAILRGVARNEAVIVFPGYARVAWWFYRINPKLLNRLQTKMIQNFRRLRIQNWPRRTRILPAAAL